MKKTDINKILFLTGNVVTLLGVFAVLLKVQNAAYLFSIGAAMLIFLQIRIMASHWKQDVRKRRLAFNGVFSSLLLGVAAYFMFMGQNSWVVAVLIYALSTFVLSFRWNQK